MNNGFTKKDLKNGDVVIHRNGRVSIAIPQIATLKQVDCYDELDYFADDLKNTFGPGGPEYDIMKVYRPNIPRHCSFKEANYTKGTLVYKREEFEEMTIAEIEKALGKKIKIVKEK